MSTLNSGSFEVDSAPPSLLQKPTSLAPHLDHLFSLSQLRNFTFLGVRNDAFTRYAFQITTARLPSTAPLKINRLEVRFGRDDVFNEDGEPNEDEPNPPNLFSSMMDLFDPLHAVFSSPLGDEDDERCPFSLILEVENWTRLRTWCWSNVALESFFNIGSPSISTLHFLENLSEDSLSFFFDDRDIKRTGWDFAGTRVVELLGVDGAPETALLLCPVVKEVVFHLSSQEDARLALDAFEYMLEDCDMEGEKRKRMTEVVRLEVDEVGSFFSLSLPVRR